jgi:hypothetical protein
VLRASCAERTASLIDPALAPALALPWFRLRFCSVGRIRSGCVNVVGIGNPKSRDENIHFVEGL